MIAAVRILSVAPRYLPGSDGAQGGHYTVYQDDLREAAARLGTTLVILAERSVPSTAGVMGALDVTTPDSIAASVAQVAEPGDLVMVYEGSLALVAAFVPLAQQRPDLQAVVNLFRPEQGLVPERSRRRNVPARRSPAHRVPGDLPSNLVVSAETEARVDFARRIGVPCAGAWRLHSTLWDVTVARDRPTAEAGGVVLPHDRLRVLVPLADRGYSKDVVRDLATVLQLLGGRRSNSGIRLTLTGAESEKFSAVIRGPRLERLGARRIVGPADREEYSELFASHDVIWIPDRTLYLSQSSGKALDALVMGRPVIGFDGS